MGNINVYRCALIYCFLLSSTNSSPMSRSVREAFQSLSGSVHADDGSIYVPPDINSLDSEVREWYLKGKANAEQDLDKFEKIADRLKKGEDIEVLLKPELTSLLAQVTGANNNTIENYPELISLVDILQNATEDSGFVGKFMIKLTVWLMDGKEDYESYFLLNGAADWIQLRVNKYLDPIQTKETEALRAELNTLKEKILTQRNYLDRVYQVFYGGMDHLTVLSGDMDANLEEIRFFVKIMKVILKAGEDPILKNSQDVVDSLKARITASD